MRTTWRDYFWIGVLVAGCAAWGLAQRLRGRRPTYFVALRPNIRG